MADLVFPQLGDGSLAQYPIGKMRAMRTVKNALADGSMILFPDPKGGRMLWQLNFTDLSNDDLLVLQNHVATCKGALGSFVFLDPTENLLTSSDNLGGVAWQRPVSVLVTPGALDPMGGTKAFAVTNQGTAAQEIFQTLNIPASYFYCFSIYARTVEKSSLTLVRRGAVLEESVSLATGPIWTRLVATGRLGDSTHQFSASVRLNAGQSVELYGPQLEAQLQPSRYRATLGLGGVYQTAHLMGDDLSIDATGPDTFSTSVVIEAPIQD
jgi:hypothetical protein